MAKDNSNSFNNNSPLSREPDSNKSFVKKVRSRVSGLLPSSLSKWFGNDDNNKASVRQREEDDDDEYYDVQPPSKRVKIPTPGSVNSIFHANSVSPSPFTSNDISRNHSVAPEERQNSVRSPFPGPTPGPSGIKSRKALTPSIAVNYSSSENLLNGDKDSDSGESTSGYSSTIRIGQKDVTSTAENKKADDSMASMKQSNLFNSSTFGGHNRSLFTERSLSPQLNSSLSSRRPSFNASTFGSPNFVDRTLSTKRIINSPFYSGRTMYGGASAYSFQQGKSPTDTRMSIRSQIQAKPVDQSVANSNATLSKTARRILNALEEYTTPVSDAKKIPNPSSKRSRPEGLLSRYTGANPYLMRDSKATPSNRELQVPTVPDLLKMKLKERLQDSTVAVRQIATTSKSALNTDEYKIRGAEEEPPKHSNKMKNKISSTRQKSDNQTVEEVKLPDIALPITTLPKFDFSLPLPPSCSKPLVTVACNDPPKLPEPKAQVENCVVQPVKSDSDAVEYKFANPLVLAENLVSIIAINDFKFSDPVFKHKDKTEATTTALSNFKSGSPNVTLKRKSQNAADFGQPAAKLLSGSIDELFAKSDKAEPLSSLDKFKPAAGMWECSVCFIRNLPDKLKCAACTAAKPAQKEASFGEQFKMSADKWECDACMVRNIVADTKCISCATPKATKSNGPIAAAPAPVSTFGDKFKPPTSTWECPTCMIRNNEKLDKCEACETPKAGGAKKMTAIGFGDSFKKKSDEWECQVCMVRNPNEKTSCVSCESLKPGATKIDLPKPKEEIIPTFNFGIFPSNKAPSSKSEKTAIFGNATVSSTTSSVPTFTFGVPTTSTAGNTKKVDAKPKELPSELTEKLSEKPGFVFGSDLANSVKPTVTPDKPPAVSAPSPKSEESTKPPVVSSVGFTFGTNFAQPVKQPDGNKVAPPIVVASSQKPTETLTEKPVLAAPTAGGFTFGTNAPSLKRSNNDAAPTPASSVEKDATSTASLIFSPPKLNSTDSNLMKKPALPLNGNIAPAETNVFGSITKSAAPPPTIPSSSFTFTPSQAPTTTVPSNLFSFGSKTTAAPMFGNTTTTTEAPVFKFNSQPEQPNNQPGFSMGSNMQPPASNVFGSNATSSIFVAPNKPAFETPVAQAAPLPAFGSVAPAGFGTTTISEIKPFSFGARPNDEPSAPKAPAFSFGQNAKPAEPSKGTAFNFGGSAPPTAPTGGFSFNSSATPAPSINFNFNPAKVENPSPFQSPAAAPSIFGTAAPVQPQPQPQPHPVQNGGFNFGGAASNSNVKSGFNFGATPQFNAQPAPAPTAGIFNFGSGNPNPAPPVAGGFNFGANPTPTFNANVKPTFNFTGGATPTFSAQPTPDSSVVVQRKKIRAVRRTQR